jgi:hypothetical protein
MRALILVMLLAAPALAQKKPVVGKPTPAPAPAQKQPGKKGGVQVMDFTAMGISGKILTPQLLYLLGRIQVELGRATLEERSFMPELNRTVEESGL